MSGLARPLRIVLLTHSIDRDGGGVAEVVIALAGALSRYRDIAVDVVAGSARVGVDATITDQRIPCPIHRYPVQGPRVLSWSNMLSNILEAIVPDLVHLHGLWGYPSLEARQWARRSQGRTCIVSPHGMLEPWALGNSALKKRIAALLYQRSALVESTVLHALSGRELEDIRHYGLTNPVCVIPNGVEVVRGDIEVGGARWRDRLPGERKVLLFLGRLHPKKNLAALIHGWVRSGISVELANEHPWQLVIAGWDQNGYRLELERLCRQLYTDDSVSFVGPQFDSDKAASLMAADAFVLPSLSEGVPMAVLEAWAYGLPVLMTGECNLEEAFDLGAALRIGTSADSIASELARLAVMSDAERKQIGERGRLLLAERYCWQRTAADLVAVYHWAITRGPAPKTLDFVI